MRTLVVFLLGISFFQASIASDLVQYLDFDFRFRQVKGAHGSLEDPDLGYKDISINTIDKFTKLITDHECARRVAAGSALLIENSPRVAYAIEEIVGNQFMENYLGKRIDHIAWTHQMVLVSHDGTQNGLNLTIYYQDGTRTTFPTRGYADRSMFQSYNCHIFTEIELINMLMEAVVQDIIVKNKNYEFTAREKLQHLASIIYSTKLGWIDVLRIARSQQDTFSQECKNLFSDETVELVRNRRIQECIESKLIGAYFSTAHLLSESDLQSASKEEINKKLRDAFDQKVNKWVKDTIPVYQKYAAYWAVQ